MSQPQWTKIAEHFRERIRAGSLIPGNRLPSDARLAEEWGVSRPTAHRALHELQRQGLVIRSKRDGTIVAESVAKATGRVALIVDRFVQTHNFPHADLIRGIQNGLGEDMQLTIAACDSDPGREARELTRAAEEADGIILYPTTDPANNTLIQGLYDRGVPLVILDRFPAGVHVDSVVSDNAASTQHAMRELLARGHRRIAFFSFFKPEFSSIAERYEAYGECLREAGVNEPERYTRWFSQSIEFEPRLLVQNVQDALFSLMNSQPGISAVFCVEDLIAAVTLQAAEGLSLSVPTDLELATFNDWPPMMHRRPWLIHRVVQRVYDIGQTAAELLRTRAGASEPRLIRVPAEFFPADGSPLATPEAPFDVSRQANGGS